MFAVKTTLVAAAVGVLLAVALNALTASGGEPRSGPLRVSRGLQGVPRPYVRGRAFVDGRRELRLAGSVSGALMGPLAPVAARSGDGRYLAYSSWAAERKLDTERSLSKQGIRPGDLLGSPALRVLDTAQGRDVLAVDGAYSAAWRPDGALAYVRGVRKQFVAGGGFSGQIVVRAGTGAAESEWTSVAQRYVVYGWAGKTLLAYRIDEGERLEVLALDGPGRVRPLSPGGVIALSPEGTRVLVVAPDERHVRLMDVGSGGELATLDLSATSMPVEWASYSGSWVGDHVVAPVSAGLIVFRVSANRIEAEQLLALDRDEFPVGVQEPVFADDSAETVVATADRPPGPEKPASTTVLECNRVARACEEADPVPAHEWLRLVRDVSRPEKENR